MINRYSSRKNKIDKSFLCEKLKNAKSYDRIAGYFCSSIMEVAGEELESIQGKIRVVCNSGVYKEDVETATAAANAIRKEWCESKPEEVLCKMPDRLKKLYQLLKCGKLEVKIIPDNVFGLIHGKAGVITLENGEKTSFLGSINETYSAWRLNYELMWEDSTEESINWVQEEFDFFWNNPSAIPLSEFIVEDIDRISRRSIIDDIEIWKRNPKPEEAIIESPVNRQELGLWEHQKYFVNMAFKSHQKPYGARYILADQVGLGKTIQLAMSAQLMALSGEKPILIIVPKTLIWQWQEELMNLLAMPTAVWDGHNWIDENSIKYPFSGDIRKCPRKVAIISQGMIVNGKTEYKDQLLSIEYDCIICDEAHRARRMHPERWEKEKKPQPNNLMSFLIEISSKTHSMLLATATPVQMYPIEAWDLLYILSRRNDSVLGNQFSRWQTNPKKSLSLIMGEEKIGNDLPGMIEQWEWLRNPFPPSDENQQLYGRVRNQLDLKDDEYVLPAEIIRERTPVAKRIGKIIEDGFIENENPYILRIVRRTREFLENNNNPETNEPYLKKIELELLGEKDAIILPSYLQKAYEKAEEFCDMLSQRIQGGGFIKTLLLKRVGSTIVAGKNTAIKMLNWGNTDLDEEDEDNNVVEEGSLKDITEEERQCLTDFINILEANKDTDPKYTLTLKLLRDGFLERGCIIFSQYFDSARFIAENLSNDYNNEPIALYAGGEKSGIYRNGIFSKYSKEDIKSMVRRREIRVLVGTDAASEGLNLQILGTLINIDLPWNPTRLEQRKGRIQRIGQINDKVSIYNMRYKDSVEDKVHEMLSDRLRNISDIFGQIPDVLEDVWVYTAQNKIEEAKHLIDDLPKQHPFQQRYEKQAIGHVDWERCSTVLSEEVKYKVLLEAWK